MTLRPYFLSSSIALVDILTLSSEVFPYAQESPAVIEADLGAGTAARVTAHVPMTVHE